MKKIEQFTNRYSLSKTLRFGLLPVGDTLKNFNLNKMLDEDEQRANDYAKVKKIIDDYHRVFIEKALTTFVSGMASFSFADAVRDYSDIYYKGNKDDSDKKAMEKSEDNMRKSIAKALQSDPDYKFLFKQELFKELLPAYLESEEDADAKKAVESFNGFSTYFTGFFNNRENMYSSEAKSTAISYRCINENLPKFLDNAKIFKDSGITEKLAEKLKALNEDFDGIYGTKVEDMFVVDYFPFVLTQSGIEKYNSIIGGYTNSDGTKVQGLNEYINLYNQTAEKKDRIPKFKQLYKQILGNKDTLSFVPDKFDSDSELLESVKQFYLSNEAENSDSIEETIIETKELFNSLSSYNANGIFVKNALELTAVSKGVFEYWGAVQDAWNDEYDSVKCYKDTEKYIEARKKAFKSVESFSLADIQRYGDMSVAEGDDKKSVSEWLKDEICGKCDSVVSSYKALSGLLNTPYTDKKKLYNNDNAIELIKTALDAVKELEYTLKLLVGTGKEENKDENFYGEFMLRYERVREIDAIYDKVRNYMTQKPYKTDKIKLNFQNPQFLGGWDRNKESDYSAVLMRKDGKYYIAVMAKGYKKSFESIPVPADGEAVYEKIIYKLLPGPNKMLPKVFFSKKGMETFNPPEIILKNYEKGTHKTGDDFNIEDCHNLIDFFKAAIAVHPDWSGFGFNFSDTSSYNNIADFYNEVKNQGYKISFCDVGQSYIDSLVSEGKLYLFQIFNKDFSEYSKGTPNLHTLYFKMLFDEGNIKNVVFKLNGESEMFFRKSSIGDDEKTVHPKNQSIKNKNVDNSKKESTFDYDLIKDRRYTVDRFMIHIPITLNFTANGNSNINLDVRKALKDCDDNYVIGIDRGERNLLYICVINSKGEIVEQFSLNEIVNEYNGNTYTTDYHRLLDSKEEERKKARVDWKTVENIKELKEGYISQVIHKICQLVEKYDAVIAMEDLNAGFKRVRGGKFEKSVYQKFEKMLIDKLNYCADKKKNADEVGSILHAYQLTNQFDSFKTMGKQNGFIFYIPAYLTSKIDPTTGFADLLHPHYESVEAAKEFFGRFDRIAYNSDEDLFEFDLDYDKYPKCNADCRKKWTVCTYGERIVTYRNAEKNNEWDNKTVNLTEAFKELFDKNGIDYRSDLKAQIVNRDTKTFFKPCIDLLALTLQMRNSETGNVDKDYLISPVKNADGMFYNSDDYKLVENPDLPKDADANGAYNIARKALWAIEQFKKCKTGKELKDAKLAMTNAEWLEYAQTK